MADFIHVAPGFAVSGQLEIADFARAADAGFRAVVNNRPDGEAAGQLASAEAQKAAEAAGLLYWAIPVSGGQYQHAIAAERAALDAASGAVLAYCRSGSRSLAMWGLAQAQARTRTVEQILKLAGEAGYDLGRLRPALEAAARAETQG